MSWLIDKGKAHYWGTSEWPVDRLQKAIDLCDKLGLNKPVVEQPEYNMLRRDRFEKEYRRMFSENGLGSTVWSPLGGGILAGKYNDGKIAEGGRYDKFALFANFVWASYMNPKTIDSTVAKM